MRIADLAACDIAILGTGREGRAAWAYLRSRLPEIQLTLVDEAPPDPSFTAQLTGKDRLLTGPLSRAGLEDYDVLIRSPGISPYRSSLRHAREAGAIVTTPSNLWFAAHRGQNTVCITGTKGKSTTSALLAHMLRACGYRVRLAGNIGKPLLDCDDRDVDWWVIELSSYQLADLEASPTVSVLLNLSVEHLDWHGDEEAYRSDKLRLVDLAGDRMLIANQSDKVLREALSSRRDVTWFNSARGLRAEGQRICDGDSKLGIRMPRGLPGRHNLSNTAAALTVIRQIGGDFSTACHAVSSFRSLPHRLQPIGEQNGVRYINDSISSTPVATAAALEALSGETVTLIVGGLDRGVDWAPYMDTIGATPPEAVISVPDNGPAIIEVFRRSGIIPAKRLHEVSGLAEAVSLAQRITPAGGVLLLSPGAPSFPRFRDYRDRGGQFARLCGFDLLEEEPF